MSETSFAPVDSDRLAGPGAAAADGIKLSKKVCSHSFLDVVYIFREGL